MRLKELLGSLSYQLIITAFGFAIAGTLLRLQAPKIAVAFGETAGICILLSVLFYRLSNHQIKDDDRTVTVEVPTQRGDAEQADVEKEVKARNE